MNLVSYLKYNKCAFNIWASSWPTVRARAQSIFSTRRLAQGIWNELINYIKWYWRHLRRSSPSGQNAFRSRLI